MQRLQHLNHNKKDRRKHERERESSPAEENGLSTSKTNQRETSTPHKAPHHNQN